MADKKAAETEKALPKTALYKKLAEDTGLDAKQVAAVFDALVVLAKAELNRKNGPEEFVIPNLVKLKLIKKPATPAKKNVPNPFKPGELMDVKAKPASKKVKPVILKGLKDLGK
jgi:hypothetical protein